MKSIQKLLVIALLLYMGLHVNLWAKLPSIDPHKTTLKIHEILKYHASYKELNPELVRRLLQLYLEELDPTKTYFIKSDIQQWLEPSDELVQKVLDDYNKEDYSVFFQIHEAMIKAIQNRRQLEKQIHAEELPSHVNPSEFKDMKWAENHQELLTRLMRLRALQISTASKLNEELKEQSLHRIEKRQIKEEEEILNSDSTYRQQFVLNNVLKATASSLDAHTAYFTPDEASQFMINVQQRLFGIGAQLRDDLNGFTVTKLIEGGPAANGKDLKLKDRIIAVNGEPVVGMDITDAVELIRGAENTPVTLTVIRQVPDADGVNHEKKLDIVVKRAEVVLKETRYDSAIEPFGDGVIAYLRLYSFYQDPEHSSAEDLSKEFDKIKQKYKVKGVILDLRNNSGGMLSQAVSVTGLFITKGIVVSIKDETGRVQHLRDIDETSVWDGPLVVLINRASASAAEIVAQTLQDYGRALIVGDDHSYGKGSFQTFTLNTTSNQVNPEGEYKVTRGRYYTVSGRTPQLTGVISDIVVPGALSESEIGEKFTKFPLANDHISENFDDDLSDIPYFQRQRAKLLYKFNLQPKRQFEPKLVEQLKSNSELRIENSKGYKAFLEELKKKDKEIVEEEESTQSFGQSDFQLTEAYNVLKDLIILQQK